MEGKQCMHTQQRPVAGELPQVTPYLSKAFGGTWLVLSQLWNFGLENNP